MINPKNDWLILMVYGVFHFQYPHENPQRSRCISWKLVGVQDMPRPGFLSGRGYELGYDLLDVFFGLKLPKFRSNSLVLRLWTIDMYPNCFIRFFRIFPAKTRPTRIVGGPQNKDIKHWSILFSLNASKPEDFCICTCWSLLSMLPSGNLT